MYLVTKDRDLTIHYFVERNNPCFSNWNTEKALASKLSKAQVDEEMQYRSTMQHQYWVEKVEE